jgi:hypothetical protein
MKLTETMVEKLAATCETQYESFESYFEDVLILLIEFNRAETFINKVAFGSALFVSLLGSSFLISSNAKAKSVVSSIILYIGSVLERFPKYDDDAFENIVCAVATKILNGGSYDKASDEIATLILEMVEK